MIEIKEIYTCNICNKQNDECEDYEFMLEYLKRERLFEVFGYEILNLNAKSKHICRDCATTVDKFFRTLR